MNNKSLWAICPILFLCFCFAQCKKNKPTKTELEKLPPITQTGANTFGCLLNGVAYTPGGGGIGWVLKVHYDPTFEKGVLDITTRRIFDNNKSIFISIGGDSINTIGIYPLRYPSNFKIFYSDNRSNCEFTTIDPPPPPFISGSLSIAKFDNVNRIISGVFEFKVLPFACDTITATNGRFDVKY